MSSSSPKLASRRFVYSDQGWPSTDVRRQEPALPSLRRSLCVVALLVASCTQLPTKEFASYREAFANARAAGEEVLLDYGTALKADEQDRAARKPAATDSDSGGSVPREFKPGEIVGEGQTRHAILVRMQAWEVISRFNDVLTSLAEGKSAEELVAATEGLYQSLSSFPIDDVAEAAGSFAPFMGVLKTLIAKAEKERSRQDFIRLVETGAPLVRRTFIKLLREDSSDFYEIRKALNDRAYSRLSRELRDLGAEFLGLARQYKPTDNLKELVTEAKTVLDEFGMGDPLKVNEGGALAFTPLVESQLSDLISAMKDKATVLKATRAELIAYYQLLTSYVGLVDELARTLDALALSIQSQTTTVPPVNELVGVYIDLRQAFNTYRTAQRGAP